MVYVLCAICIVVYCVLDRRHTKAASKTAKGYERLDALEKRMDVCEKRLGSVEDVLSSPAEDEVISGQSYDSKD